MHKRRGPWRSSSLAALVLLVIVALLIERYCSHKPHPSDLA